MAGAGYATARTTAAAFAAGAGVVQNARRGRRSGGGPRMNRTAPARLRVVIPTLFALHACSPIGWTVQAGYMQLAVGGDIALANGTGGTGGAPKQDVGTAFGLGDRRGSPYLRAQADLGSFVLTASGFELRESGQGSLDASFGGLPAATPVATDLTFGCAKLSATYDIDLGPVKLSPGLAMDVFDLEFRAEELSLGNAEVIDEVVGVPMLLLRAEAGLGVVDLVAEVGYLETPRIRNSEGRFVDAELMAACSILPLVHLFAGYRFIDIDGTGDTGTESYGIDVQVRGFVLGGGLRF